MKNNRRKVLITGGTGYIGGRVAQKLVTRADINITLGSRIAQEPPEWLPSVGMSIIDWNSFQSLLDATKDIETIIHLAAMNEIDSASNPVGALQTNALYTASLLEAAKANKVSRFIYLSTAHIYGAPLFGYIDELTLPRPVYPYASSHRAAEDSVLAAHDQKKLIGVVLRLSNGFGVPTHPDVNRWTLLVNDLCRHAVTQKKLVLRSAGLQRRDFITLSNVARVFSHMLDLNNEKVGDGLFNVGGSWAPRVIDMVELIQQRCSVVLGFTPEIVNLKKEIGEKTLNLDFRSDKLFQTGFELMGNVLDEIDETLLFCLKNFSCINVIEGLGI